MASFRQIIVGALVAYTLAAIAPLHAQSTDDIATAKALAQEFKNQFSAEHPEIILRKGALHFQTRQGLFTYLAMLHGIEPSEENLLNLSFWSANSWQYSELFNWWYSILQVDFDNKGDGSGTIRGSKRQGTYFIIKAQKGFSIVGAFGASTYDFQGNSNGMPVIEPFLDAGKGCCRKPRLEWDGTMYKPVSDN
jgi:hypothetical protein